MVPATPRLNTKRFRRSRVSEEIEESALEGGEETRGTAAAKPPEGVRLANRARAETGDDDFTINRTETERRVLIGDHRTPPAASGHEPPWASCRPRGKTRGSTAAATLGSGFARKDFRDDLPGRARRGARHRRHVFGVGRHGCRDRGVARRLEECRVGKIDAGRRVERDRVAGLGRRRNAENAGLNSCRLFSGRKKGNEPRMLPSGP